LKNEPNITYHGSVKGEVKKNLYQQAHIFCLPTYYPYEGQPFCIVEAYAGGCCVVTTNHSGIRNVFLDRFNGYEVEKKSVPALIEMIENCSNNRQELLQFGLNNLQNAKDKFTQKRYLESVKAVLKV
jgi:glycosyltransferase involved in cell wall biosynthesis